MHSSAAEIEQIVLHFAQAGGDLLRNPGTASTIPSTLFSSSTVPVSLDAQAVLGHARAVAGPVVPSSPVRV